MKWCEHCAGAVFDEEIVSCRNCGDNICGNCRVQDGGNRCRGCVEILLRDSLSATVIGQHREFMDLIDDIFDFAVVRLGLEFIWGSSITDNGIIEAYKSHYGRHRLKYISNDPENEDAIEGGVTWVMI